MSWCSHLQTFGITAMRGIVGIVQLGVALALVVEFQSLKPRPARCRRRLEETRTHGAELPPKHGIARRK